MARHCEDIDVVDVIVGMFFIRSVPYFALIDIGLTHSYIASTIFGNLEIPTKDTSSGFSVISPLSQSVQVSKVYR